MYAEIRHVPFQYRHCEHTKWNRPLHLASKMRTSGAIPLLPLYSFMTTTSLDAWLLPPTVYMTTDTPGRTTAPVWCNRIQCNWQSKGQTISSSVGCD
jgi:hypothetical protein